MDIIDMIIGLFSLRFVEKLDISDRNKSILSGLIYLLLFILVAFLFAWLF